jgi:ribosomal protein L11 methyltransferase
VAGENAQLNQLPVGERLMIQQGSVPGNMAGAFQIIVANILAEVLVNLLASKYGDPPLAEPLAPGGHLIMSGILEDRAPMVIDAAAAQGLQFVGQKQEGEWVAVIVRKAAGS